MQPLTHNQDFPFSGGECCFTIPLHLLLSASVPSALGFKKCKGSRWLSAARWSERFLLTVCKHHDSLSKESLELSWKEKPQSLHDMQALSTVLLQMLVGSKSAVSTLSHESICPLLMEQLLAGYQITDKP